MANDVSIKFGVQGEQAFKSALGAINSQVKALDTEFKTSVKAMANADDKEKALADTTDVLTRKQKAQEEQVGLLNKKVEEQRAKFDELGRQLEEAKAKGEGNEAEVARLETAYNNQATAVNKSVTELEKAKGSLEDTKTSMANLGEQAEDTSNDFSVFGDVLSASVASEMIISGVKKLAGAIKELATASAGYSDEILTLSSVTGMSTDAIQEWQYMADLVDVSFSDISGSMKKLTKNMSSARKGSGEAADAFEALGVSVTDADGELRSNQDVFLEVIDALGKIENQTEADAMAMAIFGKSAQDLNPIIDAGSGKLAELAQEAHDVGYVMGGEALEANGAFQDSMDRLDARFEGLKNQIGSAFAPTLEKIVSLIADIVGGVTAFIQEHEFLQPILAGLITAFTTLGVVLGISSIIQMVTKAFAALNLVMSLNPIGIVITLIAGLAAALIAAYNNSEAFREGVNNAFEKVKGFVSDAVQFILDAVEAIKNLPQQALQWGKDLIENFKKGIKDKIESLKNAVKSVGQTVADYIGFSEPKYGPLSNFHTFAPDMMKLFTEGIYAGIPDVAKAANAAAVNMTNNFTINGYSSAQGDFIAGDLVTRIDIALGRRY